MPINPIQIKKFVQAAKQESTTRQQNTTQKKQAITRVKQAVTSKVYTPTTKPKTTKPSPPPPTVDLYKPQTAPPQPKKEPMLENTTITPIDINKNNTNTGPNINIYNSQAGQDQLQQNYGITPTTKPKTNNTDTIIPPTATDNSTGTTSTQQLYNQTILNQPIQENTGGSTNITNITNRPDQSGILTNPTSIQTKKNLQLREDKRYLAGYDTTGTPIIVGEATTQIHHGYNPQDPDYIRQKQIIQDNLTAINDFSNVYNQTIQNMPSLLKQRKNLDGLPADTLFYEDKNQNNQYDEGIDTQITLDEARKQLDTAIKQSSNIIKEMPTIIQSGKDQKNTLNILNTMDKLGYELNKNNDGTLSFQTPSSKKVYDSTYGGTPLQYTSLAFLSSPLAIGTAVDIAKSSITGDQSNINAEMERLASYGLELESSRKTDGAGGIILKSSWSPAMIEGVYIPAVTFGMGKGINYAIKGIGTALPTSTELLSKFSPTGQNILQGIGDIGKTALKPFSWTAARLGSSTAGNLVLPAATYAAFEGPRLYDISQNNPEIFANRLSRSLFTFGLSTAALMNSNPRLNTKNTKTQIDSYYQQTMKTNPFKRYDFTVNTDNMQITGQKYADLFGKKLVYSQKEHTIMTSFNELNSNPRYTGLWNTNLGTSVPDTEFIPAVTPNQNSLMKPLNMQQLYGSAYTLAKTQPLGVPYLPNRIYNIQPTGIYTQPINPTATAMKPFDMSKIYGKGYKLADNTKIGVPQRPDIKYIIRPKGITTQPIKISDKGFKPFNFNQQTKTDKIATAADKPKPLPKLIGRKYSIQPTGIYTQPINPTATAMKPFDMSKIYGKGWKLATNKDTPKIPIYQKDTILKIGKKGVIRYNPKQKFTTRLTQIKTLKQMKNEPGLPDYRNYGKSNTQTLLKPPKTTIKTDNIIKTLPKTTTKTTTTTIQYKPTTNQDILNKSMQKPYYQKTKNKTLYWEEEYGYTTLRYPPNTTTQHKTLLGTLFTQIQTPKIKTLPKLKQIQAATTTTKIKALTTNIQPIKTDTIQNTKTKTATSTLNKQMKGILSINTNIQQNLPTTKTTPIPIQKQLQANIPITIQKTTTKTLNIRPPKIPKILPPKIPKILLPKTPSIRGGNLGLKLLEDPRYKFRKFKVGDLKL